MRKKLSLCLLFVGLIFSAQAAFLKDIPRTLIQPNGDTLHCFATGDEFYNYLHDADGYTIVQNVNTGYFVYAVRVDGEILPSQHIAGRVNPAISGLEPHVTISAQEWKARAKQKFADVPKKTKSRSYNRNRGHINNLVIFIRFAGDSSLSTPYNYMAAMFNDSTTVSSNSMYSYFKAASYNQLSITSTFYPAPNGNTILSYEDTYSRNYYLPYSVTNPTGYNDDSERTSREFALLANAVDHISSSVPSSLNIDYDNDGYVDNVVFVVKGDVGDWSDLLWPHRWALYGESAYINEKRVYDFNFQLESSTTYFNNSTLCHEMFHTLGAPDLYHYDEAYRYLSSVGAWDLMCSNSQPPQHSGAYMKWVYGNWIDSIPLISDPGVYSLKPIGSATNENLAYAIETDDPDQYFVVEYRNKANNFESGLPNSGMLIYRIDLNYRGNADYDGVTEFDEVYIFRPNGTATENGNINNAHFSQNANRTEFNSTTSPFPFLNHNTPCNISISEITMHGDSLTFRLDNLAKEGYLIVDTSAIAFETTFNTTNPTELLVIGSHDVTTSISCQTTGSFYLVDNGTTTRTITLPPAGGVLTIQYNPTAIGDDEGTLTLSSNDLASPVVITLNGICHPRYYQIAVMHSIGGVVSPNGTISAAENSNLTLQFIPDNNYKLGHLLIDDTIQGNFEGDSYTFSNISANHSLYAYFVLSDNIELYQDANLLVYPNPAHNTLHINLNDMNTTSFYYYIYDLQGRLSASAVQSSSTIDISDLTSGVYLLRIVMGDHVFHRKVAVE
ncbi:M6 family metalloprotease domain-containing protein [Bacteroidales bacterium OttesenSCG-928-B11]|nr:M6 family metalloprotease domain-containing protein [Bacteroidales bacterium OttesenSCG-928-C03]MDL2312711.1 M6 family metalloprotease domain-containing protein [Bacteroidales bacterium OttesenSCG-928-B11]MDL2326271.1 M6 family metalloprotease domain-containing protein [Bacteroidales bacterium OttesenSCG-928-A14]